MTEVWKDIQWYEWRYQVSNLWNIKSFINNRWWVSKEWKVLKMKNHSMWYKIVLLWRWNEILVHRLVAQAFLWLDINDIKTEVLHQNDEKQDNRLSNLVLWTHKENMKEAKDRWRMERWEARPNSKLKDFDIPLIRNLSKNWLSTRKIAKEFDVSWSLIQLIISWKKWQHIT